MSTDVTQDKLEPQTSIAGYLILLKRYADSKSERLFPRIIPFDGSEGAWVRHRDDDSFNHASLRPWHRQCVVVKGTRTADGLLVVDEVGKTDDPAQPNE